MHLLLPQTHLLQLLYISLFLIHLHFLPIQGLLKTTFISPILTCFSACFSSENNEKPIGTNIAIINNKIKNIIIFLFLNILLIFLFLSFVYFSYNYIIEFLLYLQLSILHFHLLYIALLL